MATIAELKELALHAARNTAPANYTKENVNDALRGEMRNLAGSINQFMKNRYDIYEIIISAADEIVPNQVIDALGRFAEVKVVPQGQTVRFRRKLGRDRAKQFITQVGLSGIYETFRLDHDYVDVSMKAMGTACSIDFERFLDGADDMADLMDIATEGMVNAVYQEVQAALSACISSSVHPSTNKYTGNGFDADEMVKLVNVVRAYGREATIFATPEFVAAMGPDAIVPATSSVGGVYHPQDIDAIHNQGFITIFRGTPIVQIPQSFIDENNKETWIDPQLAYIMPTGGEKVVKVVIEGNTQMYDFQNRDQSMEIHMYRKIGVAILTHHNWAIYQNTKVPQTYKPVYNNI